VVRAAAVLTTRRAGALVALLAALAAWEAWAERLPAAPAGWDVVLVALLVFPATFLVAWLLLPLAGEGHLLEAALVTGALAALCEVLGADGLFNVAKLLAFCLFGFW
jgi:hypothetical protein